MRKNWFSFHRYQINKKNINIIKKYLSKNNKSKKSQIIRSLRDKDFYGSKFFFIKLIYFIIKKIIRILFVKNNNDVDGYFIYFKIISRILEAYLRTKMIFTKLIRYYYYNYIISEKNQLK